MLHLIDSLRYQLPCSNHEIAEIIAAAITAADPGVAVKRVMKRKGSLLQIGDSDFDLRKVGRVFVIAFGKAAIPMTQATYEILSDAIEAGVVITKHIDYSSELDTRFKLFQGGHPIPDEGSLRGTQAVLSLATDLHKDDLVICLVSGGGSALFTMPREGVAIDDLQVIIRRLLECGATISEINTIRKHLDLVKGGGLAKLVSPARVATLILSDVVGSPMEIIASGPTVPDPSTFADAWKVLERYSLLEVTPMGILRTLQNGLAGDLPETAKPGERIFIDVENVIVADNRLSAMASLRAASQRGYHAMLLSTFIQGEARIVGQIMAGVLREITASGHPVPRPGCVIAGGETTVTVTGKGIGGRNLETGLGSVRELAGLKNVLLVSLASDGEDGPTDAAGAAVTGDTFAISQRLGLNIDQFLLNNDSYHFFEQAGGIIRCGPTGTNVNDLVFLFAY
ncbi:MAG: glycerate kinase [Anaerolineae bacterium]|nr:glycerate kinase [Anaerolineae bacterium]